ncbi:hypothetical protein [Streptomyces sp. NPDC001750]|uniref:hypothetical protein n=1 Tax=unclassified Streptomyces TaxID=2593676 RepID=UPI003678A879
MDLRSGRVLMARRTMAYRKRRAAEREQRREVLAHLLSRVDRGVLTNAERPLLRAHVEAELRESDDLRRTINGQQRRIERFIAQLAAAHDAIREAEQDAADAREQLRAYRTAEAQRQDLNTPEPQPIECRNRFHIHQVTRPGPECQ